MKTGKDCCWCEDEKTEENIREPKEQCREESAVWMGSGVVSRVTVGVATPYVNPTIRSILQSKRIGFLWRWIPSALCLHLSLSLHLTRPIVADRPPRPFLSFHLLAFPYSLFDSNLHHEHDINMTLVFKCQLVLTSSHQYVLCVCLIYLMFFSLL